VEVVEEAYSRILEPEDTEWVSATSAVVAVLVVQAELEEDKRLG